MHWIINDIRGFYIDFKRGFSANKPSCNITNWRQFSQALKNDSRNYLKNLPEYPNAILVTGCQRSGTTIMARIFSQSKDMINYWSGLDDELDAALILSGLEPHEKQGRYCFQTTYLNEHYQEYINVPETVKIIWVLRNPVEVVNSMLNNWRSSALWELYGNCGYQNSTQNESKKIPLYCFPFKRLEIACSAYCGKLSQLLEIAPSIHKDQLFIVNYEDLIKNAHEILPQIFNFTHLDYEESYASKLRKTKKPPIHSDVQAEIMKYCGPIYEEAKKLVLER